MLRCLEAGGGANSGEGHARGTRSGQRVPTDLGWAGGTGTSQILRRRPGDVRIVVARNFGFDVILLMVR